MVQKYNLFSYNQNFITTILVIKAKYFFSALYPVEN